ncbi:Agl cluster protein AglQ [Vibrio crassostreae]|nr:Agl cluster protein AglQ [Vibrio crassostreae]
MNYIDFISEFLKRSPFFPKKDRITTGTNGLYGEVETSYRILSHWSLLIKDSQIGKDRVVDFIDLFLNEFENHDLEVGPFKARDSLTKDTSNGLIGTAWNIEGIVSVIDLCRMYSLTEYRDSETTLLKMIRDIYSHYNYSQIDCNWPNVVEPDGKLLGLDRTFNHQLWFAASKYQSYKLLAPNESLEDVSHFINNLHVNQKTNHVGTIYHTLGTYPHYHKTFIKRLISRAYRVEMVQKEYGYHGFNLLAFVRLYNDGKKEILGRIVESLKVTKADNFRANQENNRYGSSYNPVGLEIAAAISYTSFDDPDILFWINHHFSNHFDETIFQFKNSHDLPTLNARLYELTYINQETKDILQYDVSENLWSFK